MRAALEAALAAEEPVYEYACFVHAIPGGWNFKPEGHMAVCPHTMRRTAVGEWEEVEK